jgi:hypothetical protein
MRRIFMMLVCAAAGFLAAACAPQTAAERAYFEQKEAERVEKVTLKNKLTESTLKDSDIVNIVTSNAAPDNVGSTDDWLKREIGSISGQILFPRWKVFRHGNTKYEVQYYFSVIDDQNRIVKHGYQWQVDALVRLVSSPHEIKFTEQAQAAAPAADTRAHHRIREEEASLE